MLGMRTRVAVMATHSPAASGLRASSLRRAAPIAFSSRPQQAQTHSQPQPNSNLQEKTQTKTKTKTKEIISKSSGLGARERLAAAGDAWGDPQFLAALSLPALRSLVAAVVAAANAQTAPSFAMAPTSTMANSNASPAGGRGALARLIAALESPLVAQDAHIAAAVLARIADCGSDSLALAWLRWTAPSPSASAQSTHMTHADHRVSADHPIPVDHPTQTTQTSPVQADAAPQASQSTQTSPNSLLDDPDTYRSLLAACMSTPASSLLSPGAPQLRATAVSAIWEHSQSRGVVLSPAICSLALRLLGTCFSTGDYASAVASKQSDPSISSISDNFNTTMASSLLPSLPSNPQASAQTTDSRQTDGAASAHQTALETGISILSSTLTHSPTTAPMSDSQWIFTMLCHTGRVMEAKAIIQLAITRRAPVRSDHVATVMRSLLAQNMASMAFDLFVDSTYDGLVAPSPDMLRDLIHHYSVKEIRLDIIGRLYADLCILGIPLSNEMQKDIIQACWVSGDVPSLARFTQDSNHISYADDHDGSSGAVSVASDSTARWMMALMDLCFASSDVNVIIRFSGSIAELARRHSLPRTLLERVLISMLRVDAIEQALPIILDMYPSLPPSSKTSPLDHTSDFTPLPDEIAAEFISAIITPTRKSFANKNAIAMMTKTLLNYKSNFLTGMHLSRFLFRAVNTSNPDMLEALDIISHEMFAENKASVERGWLAMPAEIYIRLADRFFLAEKYDMAMRVFRTAMAFHHNMDTFVLDQWHSLIKKMKITASFADDAILAFAVQLTRAKMEISKSVMTRIVDAANRLVHMPSPKAIHEWKKAIQRRAAILHWGFIHNIMPPENWFAIGMGLLVDQMPVPNAESLTILMRHIRRVKTHANYIGVPARFSSMRDNYQTVYRSLTRREMGYLNSLVERIDTAESPQQTTIYLDDCERAIRVSQNSPNMSPEMRVRLMRHAHADNRFMLAMQTGQRLSTELADQNVLCLFIDACFRVGHANVAYMALKRALGNRMFATSTTTGLASLLEEAVYCGGERHETVRSDSSRVTTPSKTAMAAAVLKGADGLLQQLWLRMRAQRSKGQGINKAASSFCRAASRLSAGPVQDIHIGQEFHARLGGQPLDALVWMTGVFYEDLNADDQLFVMDQFTKCMENATTDPTSLSQHVGNTTDIKATVMILLSELVVSRSGIRSKHGHERLIAIADHLHTSDQANLVQLGRFLLRYSAGNEPVITAVMPNVLAVLQQQQRYLDIREFGINARRVLGVVNKSYENITQVLTSMVDAAGEVDRNISAQKRAALKASQPVWQSHE